MSARSGCSLKLTGPQRIGVDVVGGEKLLCVVIISVVCVRVDFADADPVVVTTSVQEESVASSDSTVLDVAPVGGGGAAWHWFWASASAPSGGDCDCLELCVARFCGMVTYATKARRQPLTAGRRHA